MSDTGSRRTNAVLRLAWLATAIACVAAMLLLPGHETIPFHLIWIGLCLLYGFTVWRPREMVLVAGATTVVTAVILVRHAAGGYIEWAEVAEVPLSVALTAVIATYLRRRHQAVTELARLAAADRRRAESRDLLVRQVSHELRTPITIARGYTELARQRSSDPTLLADTAIVLEELDKLATITQRLLTLIQIDGDYDRRPVDLRAELTRIIDRWKPTAQRRWHLQATAGAAVHASPDRLQAALDCLLDNAVRFTGPGDSVAVTGTVGEHHWIIEISDSGSGLTAEQAAALTAAEPLPRDSRSGTGLGLTTVRTIAAAWGGTLHLRRGEHGGTTVTLRFPVGRQHHTANDIPVIDLDPALSGQ
ncbi:sensor histidine kinase [Catellatospora tritici]|uniref:sensor histidine kinase n=1 Tax=Catellatospora tritici TaxID=2851566 RepID=UPI001C2DBECC|nr:HAMP domain-containing sensor histidine kinase [Catellatospora tritici]MBV1855806.1 HAMP domain-containing histidine kinase [Catellatospora tritici]